MQSNWEKYKDEMSALERAPWSQVEELVAAGKRGAASLALLPLVPDAARGYAKAVSKRDLDWDDVIGVGNVALVEAVSSWEPGSVSLKNRCYTRVRQAISRHIGKELDYRAGTEEELEPEETPTDEGQEVLANEEQAAANNIRAWMSKNLTMREQSILTQVYFQEKSIREIARNEGKSPEAVSRVHREALKKIRENVDTF